MALRTAILGLFTAACGAAPTSAELPRPAPRITTPKEVPPMTTPPVAERPEALPTTPAVLTGAPLARLRVPENMVVALEHPLSPAALAALGVRSYRAFTATTPRVWLLVFEFTTEAELRAAIPEIVKIVGADDAAPHYRETSHTGTWLLVTGFPSEKPVSPEMEAARARFVAQWAGQP